MGAESNVPVRILMVEDSPQDAELEIRELKKGQVHFTLERVETREAFLAALAAYAPDLILSDYSLPTFDGLSALRLAHEHRPQTPFIFISGTIGEEKAIEAMREGATDYVIKGRLSALVLKVRRALQEAERRREHLALEEQFRHVQKLEAVGRLAGGVAHDYNNLLTIIMSYASEMERSAGDEAAVRGCVSEVKKASERAAALTRQLLAFSRKQVLAPVALDLNASLAEAARMLRRTLGDDIELKVEAGPGLATVWADPSQMFQVLMNLCVNARDAMPRGGGIVLRTANVELDGDFARAHPGVKAGPHVSLAVQDQGEGIAPEIRAHLFEPFFTTKEVGKGTGLGLSTVYGIVEQSGGCITVDSALGQGATFTLYFPAVPLPPAKPVEAPAPAEAPGGGTVLLVEDSEPLRSILASALRRRGFEVLEAADGQAALILAGAYAGEIGLLVVDSVMPGLRGNEVAQRLRGQRPGIQVIHMSGYPAGELVDPGALDAGTAFLQKPFNADSLVQKIQEVLGRP